MSKTRNKLLLRFDRALSNSFWKQIGILSCLLLVSLLMSYLFLSFSGCEWRQFCHDNGLRTWLLPFYLLIDSNALNGLYMGGNVTGWMLIASTLTYLCGLLIFSGMLVGVITNAIVDRVDNHRNGLIHYLKSGHYIIMGYDDMVPSIIEEVFANDTEAYVLLLSAFDAKILNERLKKSVAKKQLDHIIINYGHRTANEYYGDIHLESAKEIYIVGDRSRATHDAVNIECIDSICTYLQEHKSGQIPRRIICLFEDLDTYAAFKTTEIFNEVRDLGIEFVPYNFYTGWARQVFLAQSYREKRDPTRAIPYPSLYGQGIGPDDERFVHLVFVGTTNFAVAFAMEAAQMLHFPNFDSKKAKTRITFIEKNAEQEMSLFVTRNRHFFDIQSGDHNFLDIEFEFVKGDVYSKAVQNLIRDWAQDTDHQYLSIFLALADHRANFMMGMNMPDEVYDNGIPVFIRQDRADNFVTNLRNSDRKNAEAKHLEHHRVNDGKLISTAYHGRYANIYPFGMNDMAYYNDDIALKQAKLINYLYKTADYSCNLFKDTLVLDTIPASVLWDEANRYWSELTVALKWSNLYCAYNIPCKLASLRAMRGLLPEDTSHDKDELTENEQKTLSLVEHNRWNVEKLLMGYRRPKANEDKYLHPEFADKLKKNKGLFIHHDIRPYDELLYATQQLDLEIVKKIPWILKMTEG